MIEVNDKLLDAVNNNDDIAVQSLLMAGANANYVSYFEETPLICACKINNIKEKIVSLLLEYGADPNHKEYNGFTPLLLAVTRSNTNIVKMLLDAGANPNIELKGKNIIWYALQSINEEMLPFVVRQTGVNINSVDRETGYTCLDWSYFHSMRNFIEPLKKLGATSYTLS